MADELVELLERQVRLAPDVAELETGVVVARVLVVDQLELAPDVDEVLGEEVVVAGNGSLVADGHGRLDRAHLRLELEVALGQAEAALLNDLQIARLDPEHVEVVAKAPGAVELPAGGGDLVQPVSAAEVLGALRLPDDELEDEHVLLREVSRHGGADAGVGGRHGVQVLVLAVDREQAGVLGGDADDVGP